MYLHVYVCMYRYTCRNMYMYMYIHIIYIYIYMHTSYIYVYIYAHMYICIYTSTATPSILVSWASRPQFCGRRLYFKDSGQGPAKQSQVRFCPTPRPGLTVLLIRVSIFVYLELNLQYSGTMLKELQMKALRVLRPYKTRGPGSTRKKHGAKPGT